MQLHVRRALLIAGFVVGAASLAGAVGLLGAAREAWLHVTHAGARWQEVPRAPERPWRLVDGRHWQIASGEGEALAATDAAERTRGSCRQGMVEVRGNMKLDPGGGPYGARTIEELQKTTCTRWINREFPERCAVFDRERWRDLSAGFSARPMHFCIDRFEYPNQRGAYPYVAVTFWEAGQLCEAQGKRLCDESEWTFACEGEEAKPYPYGYVRSATACRVDRSWRPYREAALFPRDRQEVAGELDRLWQGAASGSLPECRSDFGVYDLVGNVDEWTRSTRAGGRPSILKGGYWGPVRTRCRPSTRSHDPEHSFYQQGVRCCADLPSAG